MGSIVRMAPASLGCPWGRQYLYCPGTFLRKLDNPGMSSGRKTFSLSNALTLSSSQSMFAVLVISEHSSPVTLLRRLGLCRNAKISEETCLPTAAKPDPCWWKTLELLFMLFEDQSWILLQECSCIWWVGVTLMACVMLYLVYVHHFASKTSRGKSKIHLAPKMSVRDCRCI